METNAIKTKTFQFLNDDTQLTAVLATAGSDGAPHAATIYYVVDEDFTFYFLTATDTQKYKNLMVNNQAALAIGFGPSQTTAQSTGTVTLLEKMSDEENHVIARLKRRLQDHQNETWPVFQLEKFDAEPIAVFKYTPESLWLLNLEEDNGLAHTTDDVHHII